MTAREEAWATLKEVASRFEGINPLPLWNMYCDIMRSNFEQDLYDIANENEAELKELSKGDK